MPLPLRNGHGSGPGESDGLGISVTRTPEDGTLESLMARASLTGGDNEPVLDQTVHARQAITPALAFRDTRLEQLYQADYFTRYLRLMRWSIVIGTCLWALFVINDIIKDSQGLRRNFPATVSLRFGVIGLALGALALTFSHRFGRRSITWLIVIVIVLFGAAQVGSGAIELDTTDPTYSVAIVVISSTSSAFFRLPFAASIFCNLAMYAVYVIITAATGAYDNSTHFATTCVWLLVGVGIFSILAYDREWYIRSSYLAERRLQFEESRSQRVLLKMLPLSVIEQLRSGVDFMHERHSNISVLFSHIVDFDQMSSHLMPQELIGLLNHVFSRFDSITDEYHVYKVETIGDVYLVSAGVPEPRDDHANALAHVAVSMMEAVPDFQSPDRLPVQLKIGINSGPVIAGVVGMKYPRFRLMGDVVNVSSRMSTTCKAGDIQLTPSCFHQLKPDEFIIQYRGEIDVKGKGKMKTYLLKGRVTPPSVPCTVGDDKRVNGVGPSSAVASSDQRTFIGTPRTPLQPNGPVLLLAQSNGTPRGAHRTPPMRPMGVTTQVTDPEGLNNKLILAERTSTPNQLTQSQPHDGSALLKGSTSSLDSTGVTTSVVGVGVDGSLAPGWASQPELTQLMSAQGSTRDNSTPSSTTNMEKTHEGESPKARGSATNTTATNSTTGVATVNKSSIRIHLPNHKSRTESISPRGNQVGAASGSQLDILAVVPGFGTGDEDETGAASVPHDGQVVVYPPNVVNGSPRDTPHAAMHRTSSVPLHASGSYSHHRPSPSVQRASSMVECEPTPGDQVVPSGGLVTNQVIRLSNMKGPTSVRASTKRLTASSTSTTTPLTSSAASTPLKPFKSEDGSSKDILRITAKDVQVEGLFNSIEWESLQDPKNPFSLTFKDHPELETQFQSDFFRKFLGANRKGLISFLVSMLLLGIYETLFNLPETESESDTMSLTWILRLVGLVTGLTGYVFTYTHKQVYQRYQQPILTCVWCIMGIVLISILIALDTYTDVYGVTCVILLLTMTSTFVGLQFVWVTIVTIVFLIWYLGGVLIIRSEFPLVFFFLIASNVLAIMSSRSSEYYLRWDFIRHLKLQNEERRTRHFLDNMLPKSVIQDIKADNSFIAHEFLKASVMFSDIVSFTSIASLMAPEDVVAILNVMFSTFDALTTKHNVYKVETIGDAYLACSGVVQRGPTQSQDLVRFALDLQSSTKYMHTPDGQPIVIRIGIHTGSVVAGVVGRKMPRYHLFGESVTIAEEMEQNGIPGHVVFSQATYDEVEGLFELEKLEPITLHAKPAKNIMPSEQQQQQQQQQNNHNNNSHAQNVMNANILGDMKTQLHRYKVLSYCGNVMRDVPPPPKLARILSVASMNGTPVSPVSGVGVGGRRSRPTSGLQKDDLDRAPPPFVSMILAKINAKNFEDAAEREQRRQQATAAANDPLKQTIVSKSSPRSGVVAPSTPIEDHPTPAKQSPTNNGRVTREEQQTNA